MKALLFAAGRGKRISELAKDIPKPLLGIAEGKTIIENLLDMLLLNNVKEAVIVIGFKGEKIIEKLTNNYKGIKITYVLNKDYETTNSAYSFYVARNYVKEGCLHFNADNVMHPKIIEILINAEKENAFMYDDMNPPCEEDCKVRIDEKGAILDLGKQMDPSNTQGWIIGSGKFSAEGIKKVVDIMENDIEKWKKLNIPLLLFGQGIDVYAVSSKGYPFGEIDNVEDLEKVRNEVYPKILKDIQNLT
ncbi:MAG: NTP transferase domain-containing protein [Nanoarchaeota archaeon]|nr:NTP transferase domain-containing protein [Nanoarchaeota archaeon]